MLEVAVDGAQESCEQGDCVLRFLPRSLPFLFRPSRSASTTLFFTLQFFAAPRSTSLVGHGRAGHWRATGEPLASHARPIQPLLSPLRAQTLIHSQSVSFGGSIFLPCVPPFGDERSDSDPRHVACINYGPLVNLMLGCRLPLGDSYSRRRVSGIRLKGSQEKREKRHVA